MMITWRRAWLVAVHRVKDYQRIDHVEGMAGIEFPDHLGMRKTNGWRDNLLILSWRGSWR